MNINALRHPRTLNSIKAAMWSAIRWSKQFGSAGAASVISASGKQLMRVTHYRDQPGAFRFVMDGQDVTASVLALLRKEAA